MNKTMNSNHQYKDLNDFLIKHNAKNSKTGGGFTHTRIGDKEHNIYAGSYTIPPEELDTFYGLYYNNIFVKKNKEYLTERQLTVGGPLVVDFDFRYNYDVDTRQHTKTHISDMVCEYADVLKECYLIKPAAEVDVFVFEKQNVNRLADGSLTKDGIHMLVGMRVDHSMQMVIRDKILNKLNNICGEMSLINSWRELPLINSWDSVLDSGISKGTTNWQLFGSRKPNNEAYELTRKYVLVLDPADGEWAVNETPAKDYDLKPNYKKMSVQYDKNPEFEINPNIIGEYNKYANNNKPAGIKKATSKIKLNLLNNEDEQNEDDESISITDITNPIVLERAINQLLVHLDYETSETHSFTQALPEKYYEPGSHLLNRQVAFALKHTDDRLFLSWVQLRSKASDFDFNSIPDLHQQWKKINKTSSCGAKVTKKSIMYWIKKDNFEEYDRIKKTTVDYFIDKFFDSGTEYDAALILKQLYKDKYVCVSYDKRGIWYQFKNHKWVLDKGLNLRSKISVELYSLIQAKSEMIEEKWIKESIKDENNAENNKKMEKEIQKVANLKMKLKKSVEKDHIMREAAEIFYDDEFIKHMNSNKYLLCFNNGVVDFVNKTFRDGYPEDYITKSTNIKYIPYDKTNEEFKTVADEIETFMSKLFPIEDLKRYMYDHLASCLIGVNKNQTFNVYHGSGSNGKSILTDLMSYTLGEYKGTVPITLVTDARGKIGGTSDEIIKLKGVRYAVMQEPSKGVKLNEGIMKELTGGDPIQARGLYSESEIFDPQFSLVVCTNNLFDIESNDDGTWRRIRKCDFLSKFIDDGETYNEKTPYIYKKDKSLKDKLPTLAPVFASMLVNIAFETQGIVKECDVVLAASNKYRMSQDYLADFVRERIEKSDNQKDAIGKKSANDEFKAWFQETQGQRKMPKSSELFEFMNKQFGACTPKWKGVKWVEPVDDDEDMLEHMNN